MVKIICFLVLISALSSTANAAEVGHITSEVNFRERPTRSAPIIDVLAPGTVVEVLKPIPAGWHQIFYRGRRGFVHESYVKLEKRQEHSEQLNLMRSRFVTLAGIVLVALGATSLLSIVAPVLFKLGIVLIGCALWVLTLDVAFNLGFVYSLLSAALGMLIVVSFFTRKKSNRTLSADDYWLEIKKAA